MNMGAGKDVRASVLKWSSGQQHSHHLGACEKLPGIHTHIKTALVLIMFLVLLTWGIWSRSKGLGLVLLEFETVFVTSSLETLIPTQVGEHLFLRGGN